MEDLYKDGHIYNSRVAAITKADYKAFCPSLSKKAGQDVICPFPRRKRCGDLFGSGCSQYCDVTSKTMCKNCTYFRRHCTDGGAPYCMGWGANTWHTTPRGNNCPFFVQRKPGEEDAGDYIKRRTFEISGISVREDEEEPESVRMARAQAQQEWLVIHEPYERRNSRDYIKTILPNENVSKEDAVLVGKIVRESFLKTNFKDCNSIAVHVAYCEGIADLLDEMRR